MINMTNLKEQRNVVMSFNAQNFYHFQIYGHTFINYALY